MVNDAPAINIINAAMGSSLFPKLDVETAVAGASGTAVLRPKNKKKAAGTSSSTGIKKRQDQRVVGLCGTAPPQSSRDRQNQPMVNSFSFCAQSLSGKITWKLLVSHFVFSQKTANFFNKCLDQKVVHTKLLKINNCGILAVQSQFVSNNYVVAWKLFSFISKVFL